MKLALASACNASSESPAWRPIILAVAAICIACFCLGFVVGVIVRGRLLRTPATRTGHDPEGEQR